MSFINSTTTTLEQHFLNKTQFFSPPVTPKQMVESAFHITRATEEECWDSTSTEASTSPSSSCLYFSPTNHTVANHCNQTRKKNSGSIMALPIPSHRRKQRPNQSLPTSTKGTFRMPTFLDTRSTNKIKKRAKSKIAPEKDPLPNDTKKVEINDSNNGIVIPNQIKTNSDNHAQDEQDQISSKAKTSAAYVYDNLSADWDQSTVFLNHEEWIPNVDVFNRKPMVRISWKGSPLKIRNMPYFEKLHAGEVTIAATLRLTPEQYLKCKWALVLAAKEAYENNTLFRKSEAQKVCCIDVNKTSVLWNAFGKLGWLGSKWPQ